MVSFSTTGLLLHVALFRLGTTHDCAIGQAGPSIWSRLPPAVLHRGVYAADRARGRSRCQPRSSAARRGGATANEDPTHWYLVLAPLSEVPSPERPAFLD